MTELELLIRKSTLKDVEILLLEGKSIPFWLIQQYAEIDAKLNKLNEGE
jgi:hypothetical protein